MVFLILAAQYERWSLPLAVVTSVPFALFGALLAAVIGQQDNNVYFQIGVVTLVGLAAKNAILIVEFGGATATAGLVADGRRAGGGAAAFSSHRDDLAGLHPGLRAAGDFQRRRLRQPPRAGTPVVGGMLAATFIATFFVPLFFRLIMQASERRKAPATAEEGGDA